MNMVLSETPHDPWLQPGEPIRRYRRFTGWNYATYVQAFAEGRCLELGKGNDEIAFTRGACLDVNREIIDIATSAPGLSVYFTKDGLLKLAEYRATGGQP